MSERLVVSGFLLLVLAQSACAEPLPLADPLRPEVSAPALQAATPTAEIALPRLSMIVHNTRQRHAVIDGQPRRVGDQWAGYRVLAIHTASVLLGREGGKTIELDLLSGAVVKKPAPRRIEGPVLSPAEGNPRP